MLGPGLQEEENLTSVLCYFILPLENHLAAVISHKSLAAW